MFTATSFMFLVCESPLHAGSGSELDFIDKPIQRERHTQFPKIESSSLKGAIREMFYTYGKNISDSSENNAFFEDFNAAFGAESKEQEAGKERQGGLAFTDARLLLFPVKSMKGVFAWITCPFILKRFEADMKRAGRTYSLPPDAIKYTPENGKAILFSDGNLEIQTGLPNNLKFNIILEEYAFEKQKADASFTLNELFADKIFPLPEFNYWNQQLKNNLVILSDNDFADFCEMSTEVITRNQIDVLTGTVKKGHLFTEEYLPTDSVLYTVAMTHAEFAKNGTGKSEMDILKYFKDNITNKFNNVFQAGGNATIGKGLIRTVLLT
jgi:CRISPR-associated protein Cmr4